MPNHLYCFHAEISAMLQGFLAWIDPLLFGYLGIFTLPTALGLAPRWEVCVIFFIPLNHHLVDNVIIGGTAQRKRNFPDCVQGLLMECCHNLFKLPKRLALIRDKVGILCSGGVQIVQDGTNSRERWCCLAGSAWVPDLCTLTWLKEKCPNFTFPLSDWSGASFSCLGGEKGLKELRLLANPQPLKALQKDLTCVR